MFDRSFCVCIYLILCSNALTNAAQILAVFPVPSISHQVVFRALTQELARRGHEVVILTPDPAFPKERAPTNITEIDFHDISYGMWKKDIVELVKGESSDSFSVIKAAFKSIDDVFDHQMQSKEVRDLVKQKARFDLIFTEACVKPAIVLSHVFKAPLIQVSSFGAIAPNFQVIGAPSHPVYYPDALRTRIHDLSIWEKMQGIYEEFRFRNLISSLEASENEMIKRNFGPDTPSIKDLNNNVEMLFLNVHPIWDSNRSVPPGVIYLGGLHQKPEKELPKELKSYLDNSTHGVIYMSFGTNVNPSLLPPERIQIFTEVFSKLPYDVLWKWNSNELPNRPNNVKISKWLPQSDLLRHPKIKLFITQAGLQSTDESVTAGVPLLAFPILGDQWFNAEKYVQLDIGMKLDIEKITAEILTTAIRNLINNEKYSRNIKRLGALMRDQPQTSLERAVWWTEHVIRHGGAKHLRSAAANISWTEHLMLDVVAVVLGSLLAILAVIVKMVLYLYRNFIVYAIKLKSI